MVGTRNTSRTDQIRRYEVCRVSEGVYTYKGTKKILRSAEWLEAFWQFVLAPRSLCCEFNMIALPVSWNAGRPYPLLGCNQSGVLLVNLFSTKEEKKYD